MSSNNTYNNNSSKAMPNTSGHKHPTEDVNPRDAKKTKVDGEHNKVYDLLLLNPKDILPGSDVAPGNSVGLLLDAAKSGAPQASSASVSGTKLICVDNTNKLLRFNWWFQKPTDRALTYPTYHANNTYPTYHGMYVSASHLFCNAYILYISRCKLA
jgi:hypothetical protein